MSMHEQTVVTRDVRALQIPSGIPLELKTGEPVTIVQGLGGSYTVIVQGIMARIDGSEADAIGKPRVEPPAAVAAGGDLKEAVWEQLKRVYDPEIPVNVVDLGLIYECALTDAPAGKSVAIKMSMTAPGCGMGDVLKADAERYLKELPGVAEAKIELVFDPPWDPSRMSEAARLQLGM